MIYLIFAIFAIYLNPAAANCIANSASPEIENKKLESIKAFYNLQVVLKENGELVKLYDTISIYKYQDFLLYPISFEKFHFYYPKAFLEDMDITPDSVINSVESDFFIFRLGEKKGYRYNKLLVTKLLTADFDSLVKKNSVLSPNLFLPKDYKMTDSLSFNERESLERYVDISAPCEDCNDSLYLLYDKSLLNYDFYSVSTIIEKQKKNKIKEAHLIFNPIKKGKYEIEIPRRECVFGFFEFAPHNKEEIIQLFERVINEKYNRAK